ncbi:hypothetical protein [Methanosarcina horonobensis]|nr:hypothetical protein [Methanosarcina horonobensis]
MVEPVEIDVRDTGRDELFRVLFDITKLERELELESREQADIKPQKGREQH